MEKLNKHIIFMLATKGGSHVQEKSESKDLAYHPNEVLVRDSVAISQHLYLTSKGDINIGDWFILLKTIPELHQMKDKSEISGIFNRCRKVIASTDKLKIGMGMGIPIYLPSFQQDFIKEYVDANGIDVVNVAYEETFRYDDNPNGDSVYTLRLNLNEEVIISQIEDTNTYTQKEVIAMLTKERERGIDIANAFYNKYTTKGNDYLEGDGSLKYIAEREAEVCRKIEITIDGRTLGLEPHLHNQIKNEYFNHDS